MTKQAKDILDLSGISFSSTNAVEKRSDDDILKSIAPKLKRILAKRFSGIQIKNEIELNNKSAGERRLNFACPYCGDSHKNIYAKRANIYIPGFGFHCYNCRTHTSLETFLEDHGESLDAADRIHVYNSSKEQKQAHQSTPTMDFSYMMDFDLLDRYATTKEILFKKLNLIEITHKDAWWIKKYLIKREQLNFKKFAWDKGRNRLIIFNILPSGKVLGFQARNFKSQPKYVTYTISMIYNKILEIESEDTEDFRDVERLSFLFGLGELNTENAITVFEGPLDSFLLDNGMSVCGIENAFPLDIPHRYLFDKDEAGTRKSLELLNKGETVFLWAKFMRDNKIKLKGKLDLNDIVIYFKERNESVPNLNDYFSNSKYDLMDV
jgi:hypothetical protein